MNLKIILFRTLSLVLLLQGMSASLHAGFFQIDSVSSSLTPSKDTDGLSFYGTDEQGKRKFWAVPSLKATIRTKENIAGKDTYVKCYYFDRDGKPLSNFQMPYQSGTLNTQMNGALPVIIKNNEPSKVFFPTPKGLGASDFQAVIVFGDTNEATAITYPQTLSASSFKYPEKQLVENLIIKDVKRKITIDPLVEYVAKSYVVDAQHPKITLFLRMPKDVSDSSQLQGLMAICVLAGSVDQMRRDLQDPELKGDYCGLFDYARTTTAHPMGSNPTWNGIFCEEEISPNVTWNFTRSNRPFDHLCVAA